MSKRNWKLFLMDILESIEKIESYISGLSFEEFIKDEKTKDAVVRNLEIIGEAANQVPKDVQDRFSEIYIDELAKKLELPDELIKEIYELTPDYTFSRYPDVSETVPYEQYSEEIAKEKLKIAKNILGYFKKRWGEL